jgi:hydrogenase maturation protein HypF
VIGIACDGTGYGPDGVLWGGEILLADLGGYERAAHLAEIALPGGVTAIRQPWRTAVAYLTALGADDAGDLDLFRRHAVKWPAVAALARSPLSVRTTSAGRLFDAVAALVGIRDTVNYEAQAAIELEQRVDLRERGAYPMRSAEGVLHAEDLVAEVVEDVRNQVDPGVIASRFHRGLSAGLAAAVREVRDRSGLTTVALSGGVFQNVVLTTDLAERLSQDGFTVLLHRQVPPNDGGISFGQAAIAAACG